METGCSTKLLIALVSINREIVNMCRVDVDPSNGFYIPGQSSNWQNTAFLDLRKYENISIINLLKQNVNQAVKTSFMPSCIRAGKSEQLKTLAIQLGSTVVSTFRGLVLQNLNNTQNTVFYNNSRGISVRGTLNWPDSINSVASATFASPQVVSLQQQINALTR